MGDERELEWLGQNEDDFNDNIVESFVDHDDVPGEDDELPVPDEAYNRSLLEKEWDHEPEDDLTEEERHSDGNYYGVDDIDWRRWQGRMPL